ncbi:MAG: HAD family hydrolase [Ideonella sp. MAG2]|nr:MAG: HAD family hydrolase [Ideonella sp. MAG2]
MDAVSAGIKALTLDLDDTLWPVWPTIERAEAQLHQWLQAHAPRTAARFDVAALRQVRNAVALAHPEMAHDFSWQRQTSIALALREAGDDEALAAAAFEVFFAERQRVDLYPDALAALQALSSRWPLFALTNGNADLERMGLAHYFVGGLSAKAFGQGKPAPVFFHAACDHLRLAPYQVLHVGDDWALDIEGACGAGLAAAWICRPGHPTKPAGAQAQPWFEGGDLAQLVRALGITPREPR